MVWLRPHIMRPLLMHLVVGALAVTPALAHPVEQVAHDLDIHDQYGKGCQYLHILLELTKGI